MILLTRCRLSDTDHRALLQPGRFWYRMVVMADMDNPITEITEDSCWGYLASQQVGRLVTCVDGQAQIYPVNFVLDGESVVFRTAEGSKLAQLLVNNRVAFQVDGWNLDKGWSVVVKGTADLISDEDELARADKMPLLPWIPTVKKNYVRITCDQVSGRAFQFGPEPVSVED